MVASTRAAEGELYEARAVGSYGQWAQGWVCGATEKSQCKELLKKGEV